MTCPRCQSPQTEPAVTCTVCGASLEENPTVLATLTLSPLRGSLPAAAAVPAKPRLLANRYELAETLGQGGMGVVYKARDTRLQRWVALKLLTAGGLAEPQQKARFLREARAAASLDHPNICTLYEIDEADGQTFIAMANLTGRSLKQVTGGRAIAVDDAVDFATQAAKGLAYAHAHGIIHRDIKPGNLFVTDDGILKIIDFGLATIAGEETITLDGTFLGTPAYMSPEQVTGDKIDYCVDIWALGVVLYEMIAGRRPFRGDPSSIAYAVVYKDFEPLSALREGVPPEIELVVARALAKRRDQRYQSMKEMLQDLHGHGTESTFRSTTSALTARSRPIVPSVAVLPFVDMSGTRDQEYLCEGIAEDIINAITKVKGLHVVARGSSFRFTGKSYDLAEIAQKLRVKTVLEGSVRRHENRLRITARLIDTSSGENLWSQRFDRELKDVFAIQDEIALAIAAALKVTLLDQQNEGLVKRYTENLDAYSAYLKGRHFWARRTTEGVKKAIESYQEALREDPEYAPAYAGLADALIQPGYYGVARPRDVMPKGKEAALKALEVDPTLAEGRTSLGAIYALYEHNWAEAEHQFQLAIESNPNYATAHSWYSLFVLTPMRRFEEAGAHMKTAQRLDPLTAFVNTIAGMCHYFRRNYDAAIDEFQRVLNLDPGFPTAQLYLGRALLDSHREKEAVQAFEKAAELYPRNAMFTTQLAFVKARCGDTGDAVRLLGELEAAAANSYVPASSKAILELGLGRHEAAIHQLEKAFDERELYAIWMAVDPLYDEIRPEPEFQRLIEKLGA